MVTPSKADEEADLQSKHITVGEEEGKGERERERERRRRRRREDDKRREMPSSSPLRLRLPRGSAHKACSKKKKLTHLLQNLPFTPRPLGPVRQRPHPAPGQGHPDPQDRRRDAAPAQGRLRVVRELFPLKFLFSFSSSSFFLFFFSSFSLKAHSLFFPLPLISTFSMNNKQHE